MTVKVRPKQHARIHTRTPMHRDAKHQTRELLSCAPATSSWFVVPPVTSTIALSWCQSRGRRRAGHSVPLPYTFSRALALFASRHLHGCQPPHHASPLLLVSCQMGPDDFNDLALDDINEAGENNGELDEASAVNLVPYDINENNGELDEASAVDLVADDINEAGENNDEDPEAYMVEMVAARVTSETTTGSAPQAEAKAPHSPTEERQSTGPRKKGGKGSQGQGGHNNSLDGKIHSTETKAKLKRLIKTDPDLTNEHGLILWSKVRKHFPQKTEASLRNLYSRSCRAQKEYFSIGTHPKRCCKFGCGLIKRSHLCLNEHGEEVSQHKRSKLHHEADALVEFACYLTGKTLTVGEANDYVAYMRGLENHTPSTAIVREVEESY